MKIYRYRRKKKIILTPQKLWRERNIMLYYVMFCSVTDKRGAAFWIPYALRGLQGKERPMDKILRYAYR